MLPTSTSCWSGAVGGKKCVHSVEKEKEGWNQYNSWFSLVFTYVKKSCLFSKDLLLLLLLWNVYTFIFWEIAQTSLTRIYLTNLKLIGNKTIAKAVKGWRVQLRKTSAWYKLFISLKKRKRKHFSSLKPWLQHHRNWDEGTGGVVQRFGKIGRNWRRKRIGNRPLSIIHLAALPPPHTFLFVPPKR